MRFKRDPGPCPVDDAPHTTCTSPDYLGVATELGQCAIAITQLACRDGVALPRTVVDVQVPTAVAELRAATPVAELVEEVSTATYRRLPGQLPGLKRRR